MSNKTKIINSDILSKQKLTKMNKKLKILTWTVEIFYELKKKSK